MPRQLRLEIDRLRALDVREVYAAPGDQFLGERTARLVHVRRLHHGLHFLAKLLVRHPDHGDIGNLTGMRFKDWIKAFRRYDFDARACGRCQFNEKNRVINYLLEPNPAHVNFV